MENNKPAVIKNELPTLKELVSNVDLYEKQDKFNFLMNQEPPAKWIALHPFIKIKNEQGQYVPYPYLPIDKVEYLMRKIFKEYRIEVLREGTSFNGVYVCVRVHYKSVISGEWDFHDGIGASQLQTAKGKSAADMININNGAISMAFPLAKTLAIKDACDMFGKIFGADLNRRDTLGAAMDKVSKPIDKDVERIISFINEAKTIADLAFIQGQVADDQKDLFVLKWISLSKSKSDLEKIREKLNESTLPEFKAKSKILK